MKLKEGMVFKNKNPDLIEYVYKIKNQDRAFRRWDVEVHRAHHNIIAMKNISEKVILDCLTPLEKWKNKEEDKEFEDLWI